MVYHMDFDHFIIEKEIDAFDRKNKIKVDSILQG